MAARAARRGGRDALGAGWCGMAEDDFLPEDEATGWTWKVGLARGLSLGLGTGKGCPEVGLVGDVTGGLFVVLLAAGPGLGGRGG